MFITFVSISLNAAVFHHKLKIWHAKKTYDIDNNQNHKILLKQSLWWVLLYLHKRGIQTYKYSPEKSKIQQTWGSCHVYHQSDCLPLSWWCDRGGTRTAEYPRPSHTLSPKSDGNWMSVDRETETYFTKRIHSFKYFSSMSAKSNDILLYKAGVGEVCLHYNNTKNYVY